MIVNETSRYSRLVILLRYSLTEAGCQLAQRLQEADQQPDSCEQVPFTIHDAPAKSPPRLPELPADDDIHIPEIPSHTVTSINVPSELSR